MYITRLARGRLAYYVKSSVPDDAHLAEESPGRYLGSAPARWGLSGLVEARALAALCAGAHPATGERLDPAHGRVRVVAFDLTFGAPKAASVLFGVGSPAVGRAVEAGHEAAVAAAVGYLERRCLAARRTRGDTRVLVPVTGACAAGFLHRTSRAGDPHLHSHVVLANLVEDEEGRFSALDSRGLYAEAATIGQVYHAAFRYELARRVTTGLALDGAGRLRIEGVDPSLLAAFGRRRQDVEARLSGWGATSQRAARAAALATRPGKPPWPRSLEELREAWVARARLVSPLAKGLEELEVREGEPVAAVRSGVELDTLRASLLHGDAPLAQAEGFSRSELVRAVCAVLPHGGSVEEIEALADALVRSPDVVERSPLRGAGRLGPAVAGRARNLVSAQRLAAEERFLASAKARVARVSPEGMGTAIAKAGFAPEGRARVAIAGPGSLEEVASVCARLSLAGRAVVATAPREEHAAHLAAVSGVEAVPLRALLADLDAAPRLLDEAVLVVACAERIGLDALQRLVGAAGGLVLVPGSRPRRDGPVTALELLQRGLGGHDLVLADAEGWPPLAATPQGQRAPAGRFAPLWRLDERTDVAFATDPDELVDRLVTDWVHRRVDGKAAVMVAWTPEARATLERHARAQLGAAGRLGPLVCADPELHEGDLVVARWGGFGLAAGTLGVVLGASRRAGVVISLEGGRTCQVSHASLRAGRVTLASALSPDLARRSGADELLVLGPAFGERSFWARPEPAVRSYLVMPPVPGDRWAGRTQGPPLELLGWAAEACGPRHLVELLGPVPEGLLARRRWREVAARIEEFRVRVGPSFEPLGLGEPPAHPASPKPFSSGEQRALGAAGLRARDLAERADLLARARVTRLALSAKGRQLDALRPRPLLVPEHERARPWECRQEPGERRRNLGPLEKEGLAAGPPGPEHVMAGPQREPRRAVRALEPERGLALGR